MTKTFFSVAACMTASWLAAAEFTVGDWKATFSEPDGKLILEHAKGGARLEGALAFEGEGAGWTVRESRESYRGRLTICDAKATMRGYVTLHGTGGRLVIEGCHRTGRDNFTGRLTFTGTARVREDSFTCRTYPAEGERVLNFFDGTGDLPVSDSIFSPEGDFALRFKSRATRLATKAKGEFSVVLAAEMHDSAFSTIVLEADEAYYKGRWTPGFKPINRARCPHAPTGWMSWNVYFDKAGAKENLDEARVAKKWLQPFGLEIWSIESWQAESEWIPVSRFHNLDLSCHPIQFAEGMKKLADDLRALGYRPGMWMPLYGTGNKSFYEAHKDWFLHDENGQPISTWNGVYTLDYSVPAVLDHIRKITRTASREWGYEFFKFDGMAQKPISESPRFAALRKNPNDKDWFVNSVKAFREGIGEDRILLGSMSDFSGIEIGGNVDASRLGADIASLYLGVEPLEYLGKKSRVRQAPIRWGNVMNQVDATYGEAFYNNIMMYIDPDTLLVNRALEKNEAQAMATVVGIPGQVMFAGDKLAELSADRMKILQQALPVADIRPVSLYPYFSRLPVWNLKVSRPFGVWHDAALFNFDDSEKRVTVSFAELGLDPAKAYTAYEFWQQKWMGRVKDGLDLTIPAHTVRLIALWESVDHPQFVGDDRHLTQGAVELKDLTWDAAAKTYTVNVKAVGTFPLEFAIAVPEGFEFKSAAGPAEAKVSTKAEKDLVRVTVTVPKTAEVAVKLQF